MNYTNILNKVLVEAIDLRLIKTKNRNLLAFFLNIHQLKPFDIEFDLIADDMDYHEPEDEEHQITVAMSVKNDLDSPEKMITFFTVFNRYLKKHKGDCQFVDIRNDSGDEFSTRMVINMFMSFMK